MREVIRHNELGYADNDDEVDFELTSPNQFVGPNVGLIPLQNAVQPTRLFYGARFANQAQPVVRNEAPLVQTQIDGRDGISFDDDMGTNAGAIRIDEDATVEDVTPNSVILRTAAGKPRTISLYSHFPFNRYSGLHQTPVVQKGQALKANDLLARSNYTDDKGTMALGLNALIGLVPYKGHSMDDAIVISKSFGDRAITHHIDTLSHDLGSNGVQGGTDHFVSLFPDAYNQDQLGKLDEHGIVQVGQTVNKDDPLVLASRPRNMNSAQSKSLGRLGRQAKQLRADATLKWDAQDPGVVTDVVRKKDGTVKVIVESRKPTRLGDKLSMRSGQKATVSKIVPDNEMPRTASGQVLDVLLNQQGIPSRANPSLIWELLFGKIAAKQGAPIKLPAFNKQSESWLDTVEAELAKNGLTDKERVYDPAGNRMLSKPITVGNGYILRLHHIAENKSSSRGQTSYDANQQPLKGSTSGGGAKRRSGLEVMGMLSSGAYNNLRENMTLGGSQQDDFWRALRAGQSPKPPGAPFVWHKFRALLRGAGIDTRDRGKGKLRLAMMTDKALADLDPLPVRNGDLVDFNTLAPKPGGLFDTALVGGNRYGYIDLPEPMPQPSSEDSLRHLLGLTRKDFESVLAGEASLQDFQ